MPFLVRHESQVPGLVPAMSQNRRNPLTALGGVLYDVLDCPRVRALHLLLLLLPLGQRVQAGVFYTAGYLLLVDYPVKISPKVTNY